MPVFMWLRGVTVSALDPESSDRGSNPREALSFPAEAKVADAYTHSGSVAQRAHAVYLYVLSRSPVRMRAPKSVTLPQGETKGPSDPRPGAPAHLLCSPRHHFE